MAASPGFAHQRSLRTVFRVVGLVALAGTLVLLGLFARDFLATMNDEALAESPNFGLVLAAMPLLLVAGFCLNAGFGGAAARYAAGEAMPVVKESLDHLRADAPAPSGRRCTGCDARNDDDASFCDACGQRLA